MAQDKDVSFKFFVELVDLPFVRSSSQEGQQRYYAGAISDMAALLPLMPYAAKGGLIAQLVAGCIAAQLHSTTRFEIWLYLTKNSLRGGSTVLQVLMLLDRYCA